MFSKTTSGKIQRLFAKKAFENQKVEKQLETWSVDTNHQQKSLEKSTGIALKEEIPQEIDPKIANKILTIIGEETEFPIYQIQPQTSFFDLGISSIQSIRITGKLSEIFQLDIPASLFLEHASLQACSLFIAALQKEQENQQITSQPIEKITAQKTIPASFEQRGLWLIDQVYGSVDYHLHQIVKIDGELSVTALQKAFTRLIENNEILRTYFVESFEGDLLQEVLTNAQPEVIRFNILENEIQSTIETFVQQPFEIVEEVCIRIAYLETPQENYLVFVVHHIVIDGFSQAILFEEFVSLYNDYNQGRAVEIKNQHQLNYRDYAFWQQTSSQKVKNKRTGIVLETTTSRSDTSFHRW